MHLRNHNHIDFEGLSYEEGIVSDRQELDVYEMINEGSFGKVYKGSYCLHSILYPDIRFDVAVKRVKCKDIYREAETLLELKNEEEIVHIYNYYTRYNDYLLVTELCKGGDMVDYLSKSGPIEEERSVAVLSWLLKAVDKCHKHGICHNDIKLDNIGVVKEGDLGILKLLDFGNSRKISDGPYCFEELGGSEHYAAPELFSNPYKKFGGKELTLIDAYAVGVVSFMLAKHKFPFVPKEYRPIRRRDLEHISSDFFDFIQRLLAVDPKGRMGISEALNHPFITRNV